MASNPILQELDNLSPAAKQVLANTHAALANQAVQSGASTAAQAVPPVQTPPSPVIGGAPANALAKPLPNKPLLATTPTPATSQIASKLLTSLDDAGPAPFSIPMRGLPDMSETPAPTMPNVIAPRGTSTGDQNYLSSIEAKKPALENIYGSIIGSSFGQSHPIISRLLGGLAQIPATTADAAISTFSPRFSSFIPGTTTNHSVQVANAEGQANQSAATEQKQAATDNLRSMPQLNEAKLKIAQGKQDATDAKNQATEQHQRDQDSATLAQHGYKRDETGQIVPLKYEEMSLQQQAVTDLKGSQEELASAQRAYKEAQTKNMPLQMEMAQQRIQTAQRNAGIAASRLGLSEQEFAFNQDKFYNPQPTATQRDAAGRASTMEDLGGQIRDQLQDPDIREAMGAGVGRFNELAGQAGVLGEKLSKFRNDLVSYGAFQAGMHPVRGIGALEYFDKVMGGLGQNPNELLGKLDSGDFTAHSVQKVGSTRPNPNSVPSAPTSSAAPKENDTKTNASGDKLIFKGGRWQLQ